MLAFADAAALLFWNRSCSCPAAAAAASAAIACCAAVKLRHVPVNVAWSFALAALWLARKLAVPEACPAAVPVLSAAAPAAAVC